MEKPPVRVDAPWSIEQTNNLNRFQKSGLWHEFTCARDHSGERRLIAQTDGWRCPVCGYRQTWAHPFMAEFTAEKAAEQYAQLGHLLASTKR